MKKNWFLGELRPKQKHKCLLASFCMLSSVSLIVRLFPVRLNMEKFDFQLFEKAQLGYGCGDLRTTDN